ncbi:MAG TPA: beta-phosphoglucomutase family hydrolase [Mycobacterium sp.]
MGELGLPQQISACLFDLDGVLTDTARVHAAAWKEMFDSYLKVRAAREDTPFVAFDEDADYDAYVDGKPRADGTRSFLEARGIDLPEGDPGDPPDAQTVQGLGNRKNEIVLRRIRRDGVQAYPGSVAYVRAVRDGGLRRAVVSSSTNCRDVLMAAGIEDLFEQRIDGLTAQRDQLAGKPAPDMFLAAAKALGVDAPHAVVFEDALAGVAAGRAGGFGYVVGVDRAGQAEQLVAHGADTVVTDLADLMSRR